VSYTGQLPAILSMHSVTDCHMCQQSEAGYRYACMNKSCHECSALKYLPADADLTTSKQPRAPSQQQLFQGAALAWREHHLWPCG
jgi:hypothetical protein